MEICIFLRVFNFIIFNSIGKLCGDKQREIKLWRDMIFWLKSIMSIGKFIETLKHKVQ